MDITEQEFNRLCAEFMDYEISPENHVDDVFIKAPKGSNTKYIFFRPYSDANDRNKVIEKMRINMIYEERTDGTINEWRCIQNYSLDTLSFDKSLDAAQIECIEQVLAIHKGNDNGN